MHKKLVAITLLALLGGVAASADEALVPRVELKNIKIDALKELIKQQKGKVVVVDFWADT